jgi:hypothetical protein
MSSRSQLLLWMSTGLNRLSLVETPSCPAYPAISFVNTKVEDGHIPQRCPFTYRLHSAYSSLRL